MRTVILLCCSLALLSGCAWIPSPEAPTPGEAERTKLRALSTWVMEGRLNVRTVADNWTANLEWRHTGDEDHLVLSGPFAQRAATIHYKPNFVAFDAADGSHSESSDPNSLLLERLGFSVPLSALRYWLLALPAPEQNFVSHTTPSPLSAFDQAGWSMRYGGFMQEGTWVVPRKMMIQGQGVTLKLFVDRWDLADK